jgi:hypothetical protein
MALKRGSLFHLSPAFAPIHVSARHQGYEPTNVKAMNFPIGMRDTPAGKAMKVRTTGRSRPTNTTHCPQRWNRRSARSSSRCESSTYRP